MKTINKLPGWSSNGFILILDEGKCTLWRPADAYSGLQERKIPMPNVRRLDDETVDISNFAVDVAQDLLICSRKLRERKCVFACFAGAIY